MASSGSSACACAAGSGTAELDAEVAPTARAGSRASAWIAAGSLLNGVGALAFQILGTRALGPDAYAPIGVLWTLQYLWVAIAVTAIEAYVTRHVVLDGAGTDRFRRFSRLLGRWLLATAIVAAVVGVALRGPLFAGLADLGLVLGLVVAGYGWYGVLRGRAAGLGEFRRYAGATAAESLIRLGAAAAVVAVVATTTSLAWVFPLGPLAVAAWVASGDRRRPLAAEHRGRRPPSKASKAADPRTTAGGTPATAATSTPAATPPTAATSTPAATPPTAATSTPAATPPTAATSTPAATPATAATSTPATAPPTAATSTPTSPPAVAGDGVPPPRREATRFLVSTSLANGAVQFLLAGGPLVLVPLGASAVTISVFFTTVTAARVPMTFALNGGLSRLLPPLVRMVRSEDVRGLRRAVMIMVAFLGTSLALSTAAAALVGPELVTLIFGEAFRPGRTFVVVVAAASVLAVGGLLLDQLYIALGQERWLPLVWAGAVVAGLVLALVLPGVLELRVAGAFAAASAGAVGVLVAGLLHRGSRASVTAAARR